MRTKIKQSVSFLTLFLFTLGLTISSCKKDLDIIEQQSQSVTPSFSLLPNGTYQNINVVNDNGTLKFQSFEDFERALAQLEEQDSIALNDPNADPEEIAFLSFEDWLGFTSLRSTVFDAQNAWESNPNSHLLDFNSSPEGSCKIFDEALKTVLNPNRVVKIGCSLFKFIDEAHAVEAINCNQTKHDMVSTLTSLSSVPDDPEILIRHMNLEYPDVHEMKIILKKDNSLGLEGYRIIPRSTTATSYLWSIPKLGFTSTDVSPSVIIPDGTKIEGTVTYLTASTLTVDTFSFSRLACPGSSDILFTPQIGQVCNAIDFGFNLVPGPGNFVSGLLDLGNGQYLDILNQNSTATSYTYTEYPTTDVVLYLFRTQLTPTGDGNGVQDYPDLVANGYNTALDLMTAHLDGTLENELIECVSVDVIETDFTDPRWPLKPDDCCISDEAVYGFKTEEFDDYSIKYKAAIKHLRIWPLRKTRYFLKTRVYNENGKLKKVNGVGHIYGTGYSSGTSLINGVEQELSCLIPETFNKRSSENKRRFRLVKKYDKSGKKTFLSHLYGGITFEYLLDENIPISPGADYITHSNNGGQCVKVSLPK